MPFLFAGARRPAQYLRERTDRRGLEGESGCSPDEVLDVGGLREVAVDPEGATERHEIRAEREVIGTIQPDTAHGADVVAREVTRDNGLRAGTDRSHRRILIKRDT